MMDAIYATPTDNENGRKNNGKLIRRDSLKTVMNAQEYERTRRKENGKKISHSRTPDCCVPLAPPNQSRSGSGPALPVESSYTTASSVRSLKSRLTPHNPSSRQAEYNNVACVAESSAMAQRRAELLQDYSSRNAAYPHPSWGSRAESSDVSQRRSGGSQGSFHSRSNPDPTQHSGYTTNYQTDCRTRTNIIQQSSGGMYFPRDYFSPIPHTSEPSSTAGAWPRNFHRPSIAIAGSHTHSYRGSREKQHLPQTIDNLSNKYSSANDEHISQPLCKEQWNGGNEHKMIQEFEKLRISQESERQDSKSSQPETSPTEDSNITQQITGLKVEQKYLILPPTPIKVSSVTGRASTVSSNERMGQLQAQPQSLTCDVVSPLVVTQEIRTENESRHIMEACFLKEKTPEKANAQAPSTSYSRGQIISLCRRIRGLDIIKSKGFVLKNGVKKAVKLLLELCSISIRCRVGNDVAYREALRRGLGAGDFMRYMDVVDDWIKSLQTECAQPLALKSIEEDSWTAFVWRELNNIFRAQHIGQDVFPELLDAYLRAPSDRDKRDLDGAWVPQSHWGGFEIETCPITTKSSNEYSNESPDTDDQEAKTIYDASHSSLSAQGLNKTEHTQYESKGGKSFANYSLSKRENMPTGSTEGRCSESMNNGKDKYSYNAEHAPNLISANDPTGNWPWNSLCIPPIELVSAESGNPPKFSSVLNKSGVKILAPLPNSSGVFSGSGWRYLPVTQFEAPDKLALSPREERYEPSFDHLEDVPLSPDSPPINSNEGEWIVITYDERDADWVDVEAEGEDIVGKRG
jgi:hypothetical protein